MNKNTLTLTLIIYIFSLLSLSGGNFRDFSLNFSDSKTPIHYFIYSENGVDKIVLSLSNSSEATKLSLKSFHQLGESKYNVNFEIVDYQDAEYLCFVFIKKENKESRVFAINLTSVNDKSPENKWLTPLEDDALFHKALTVPSSAAVALELEKEFSN